MFAILASACDPSPCLNGGKCVKGRTRASFTCECPKDYIGTFCQVGNILLLNVFILFYLSTLFLKQELAWPFVTQMCLDSNFTYTKTVHYTALYCKLVVILLF